MSKAVEELASLMRARLGDRLKRETLAHGELSIDLAPEDLINACIVLRDDPDLSFEQLSDLCGLDYSAYGQADWQTQDASESGFSRGVRAGAYGSAPSDKPRFAVVYHLLSVKHNRRLRVRSYPAGDPPMIDSVTGVWASADWYEREAFDLYGILFNGHPDLRRILTDYGFIGHPFRKDFPLEGNVEVRYDPEKKRVVYQPVTIENRVLVPRVIRQERPGTNGHGKAGVQGA
jgi:NADH-quinone oxidoreductase subunit C